MDCAYLFLHLWLVCSHLMGVLFSIRSSPIRMEERGTGNWEKGAVPSTAGHMHAMDGWFFHPTCLPAWTWNHQAAIISTLFFTASSFPCQSFYPVVPHSRYGQARITTWRTTGGVQMDGSVSNSHASVHTPRWNTQEGMKQIDNSSINI